MCIPFFQFHPIAGDGYGGSASGRDIQVSALHILLYCLNQLLGQYMVCILIFHDVNSRLYPKGIIPQAHSAVVVLKEYPLAVIIPQIWALFPFIFHSLKR